MHLRHYVRSLFLGTLYILYGCSPVSESAYDQEVSSILEIDFNSSLIIPVIINQQTYRFLVDTGASTTIINKEIASRVSTRISFEDIPATYKRDFSLIRAVSGELNQQDFNFLKPVPFSIGSQKIFDNDIWLSIDLDFLTQVLGVPIDGIIGIDTFRKLNWAIDNDKQSLSILKNAPSAAAYEQCIGYEDSYNSTPEFLLSYGDDSLRLQVDTGADETYLSKDFINYLEYKNKEMVTLVSKGISGFDAGGNIQLDEYIVRGLSFNGMSLGEIKVTGNYNNKYALGIDFFSRFRRYAFMPSRMMFCYDGASIIKSQQTPLRSIAIRYFGEQIEIFYNKDSDLNQLGLRNGDVIRKVNGASYLPVEIGKVRKLLSMIPAGNLELIILRNGEEKIIKL